MISTCLLPRFRLLFLLLAVDAAFIALYGLYGSKFLTDPKFGLIEDWSYGEVFQYIKEFWILLLLLLVAVQLGSWRYATWVGVFGYLLLDDSCQIHEVAGTSIHQWLGIDALGSLSGCLGSTASGISSHWANGKKGIG